MGYVVKGICTFGRTPFFAGDYRVSSGSLIYTHSHVIPSICWAGALYRQQLHCSNSGGVVAYEEVSSQQDTWKEASDAEKRGRWDDGYFYLCIGALLRMPQANHVDVEWLCCHTTGSDINVAVSSPPYRTDFPCTLQLLELGGMNLSLNQ
ncbi:hypothetical protein M433DRAFT_274458 [Acidomyces richmondensis BFW]|nr:MAG: hypothetical protein FE78DRAFT_428673 [Acidomyces sp. 'richmondensis']KYG45013.1 hypothetical protein M433DRAFT_274458 [Acidomyces richmondensis BFW]